MRYAKQNDLNNCGPVAVWNACVWAGFTPDQDDLEALENAMGYDPEIGTCPDDIDVVVETGPWESFACEAPTMSEVDEWLENGGAIIIQYPTGPVEDPTTFGHISFIEKKVGKRYKLVNDEGFSGKSPIQMRNRKTIEKRLRETCEELEGWNRVWWFLAKKP